MRSGISYKVVAALFGAVLVLYLATFYGCEHLRHRRGPWQVTFISATNGTPSIVINQPALGIQAARIAFHGEDPGPTNVSKTVAFDIPERPVPFGKVIYEDLTFLPGVVTFDLFGHEIELLPRTLVVNRKEVPWQANTNITLSETNKLPQPLEPPSSRRGARRRGQ